VDEPELEAIVENYTEYWNEQVLPFFTSIYEQSGLDMKTVELIVTALCALRGWETGVRVHAQQALEQGATPQDVRGAILICMSVGGIHRAAQGLHYAEPILSGREQTSSR
jgi:4-carboxymuconolactone decarboxylase